MSDRPMRRGGWRILAEAAAVSLLATAALADDTFFYRIDVERLGCITAHAETYLEAEADPLFVVPDRCPPDAAPTLDSYLTNEAPDIEFQEEGEIDTILVLSPSHLRCLVGLPVPPHGQILRFYPDACRLEVDEGTQ